MSRIPVSALTVAALLLAPSVRPQAPSGPVSSPQFDAASVKLLPPGTPPPGMEAVNGLMSLPPGGRPPQMMSALRRFGGREHGRYTYPYITLKLLLQTAYHLPADRVSGPPWIDSERYSLAAVMPPETPNDRVLLMLQNLLKERFQLKLRFEDRQASVYALVVGKNGPKLKKSEDPPPEEAGVMKYHTSDRNGAKNMEFTNASMEGLARTLSTLVDRPVIDMTGLSGAYDFKLEWSENPADQPQSVPGGMPGRLMGPSTDPIGMLRSLAGVGLKAEARKAPLQFLIVDQAEKVPTEN